MSQAGRLKIKAIPGASRSEIVGKRGEALKIRVAAPPEGGKANREIVALVAAKLGLSLNCVAVLSGQSSPAKVLSVEGLSAEVAWSRLLA